MSGPSRPSRKRAPPERLTVAAEAPKVAKKAVDGSPKCAPQTHPSPPSHESPVLLRSIGECIMSHCVRYDVMVLAHCHDGARHGAV